MVSLNEHKYFHMDTDLLISSDSGLSEAQPYLAADLGMSRELRIDVDSEKSTRLGVAAQTTRPTAWSAAPTRHVRHGDDSRMVVGFRLGVADADGCWMHAGHAVRRGSARYSAQCEWTYHLARATSIRRE